MGCAKTAEAIEMSFGGLTLVRPKSHVLDGSQDRANPFAAARGDKSATRPFVLFENVTFVHLMLVVRHNNNYQPVFWPPPCWYVT